MRGSGAAAARALAAALLLAAGAAPAVRVSDYRGPLGSGDDPPDVYFRLGLYRDRMAEPMVLHFDEFRTERLAA
jgi:hypothetical protein